MQEELKDQSNQAHSGPEKRNNHTELPTSASEDVSIEKRENQIERETKNQNQDPKKTSKFSFRARLLFRIARNIFILTYDFIFSFFLFFIPHAIMFYLAARASMRILKENKYSITGIVEVWWPFSKDRLIWMV